MGRVPSAKNTQTPKKNKKRSIYNNFTVRANSCSDMCAAGKNGFVVFICSGKTAKMINGGLLAAKKKEEEKKEKPKANH